MYTINLTPDEIKLLNKMLLEQTESPADWHPKNTLYAKMNDAIGGKDIRTI